MWYLRTAYSVITVLGAEVPLGRLLTVWIAGLARQSLLSVQDGPPLPPDWLPSDSPPLPELCQVICSCDRPGSDLAGLDPVRGEQPRRRHVQADAGIEVGRILVGRRTHLRQHGRGLQWY